MLVALGKVDGVGGSSSTPFAKVSSKKPIVTWCIGTCAKMFATEVQLRHADAVVKSKLERADAKNKTMRTTKTAVAGLSEVLKETHGKLFNINVIVHKPERDPPAIPIDYKWARELGLVCTPATFISASSDEPRQELLYANTVRISDEAAAMFSFAFANDHGLKLPRTC